MNESVKQNKQVDEITAIIDQIVNIISKSETYLEYERAYNRIKNNSETMEKIKQMKSLHLDFAQSYLNGNRDFGREKYISQEFFKVMLDKDVETYFMNQHKLVKRFNDIIDKISTDCKLHIF